MQYFRFTETVKDVGKLIPVSEDIYKYVKQKNKDYYKSLFFYTEDHKKIFNEKNTVAGIVDVFTNRLIFDFDSADKLDQAKSDTLTTITRLKKSGIPESSIQIYFSGNKGFNLEVEVDQLLTPKQLITAARNIAGDLQTFDPSIYNASRIIRVPLTVNEKTGLYKIPLDYNTFVNSTISQIQNFSKHVDDIDPTEIKGYWTKAKLPEKLLIPKKEEKKERVISLEDLNLFNKPIWLPNCKYSLSVGYFNSGLRNNVFTMLAATYKNEGFPQEVVFNMLRGVANLQAEKNNTNFFTDKELDVCVSSVFKDTWQGGIYSCKRDGWLKEYCNSLGEHSCEHSEKDEVAPQKIDSIRDSFKNFVVNIDENTIKTGIRELDEKLPITIGMNLGILGPASVGKTSIILEILKNTCMAGVPSVFASLDMHRNRLFEKLLYKVSGGMDRKELYKIFQEDREHELIEKIKKEYGCSYFYDRSSPSIDDIRRYIKDIKEKEGVKIKLVVIDYFERVSSDKSEDTAGSKEVAGKIQDLINDFDVAVITLVQPNKFSISQGPDVPITSYTAIKGSSFLYQSFRGIVSLTRPFYNYHDKSKDKYIQMNILKNDLGELDSLLYGFDGKTSSIKELTDFEKAQVYDWIAEKESTKKSNTDYN